MGVIRVVIAMFKKLHVLYNQTCIYREELRTESDVVVTDYTIENVRIQSQDLLIEDIDKSNSSGGFALYYLIDSANPSTGLPTGLLFKENSKIVYLGKEYVIESVKRDVLRNLAQYKVVFK